MWPKWWYKLWKIWSASISGQPRAPLSHWMMISQCSSRQSEEDQILAAFPDQMLTSEVHESSVKVFGVNGREPQAHSWCNVHCQEVDANHTCGSILVDHARPLQPVIKLKGWHVWCINPLHQSAERVSFNDMIPDGSASHDLPQAVRIVAVAVAHLIKAEYCIKASIIRQIKTVWCARKTFKTSG